jgi:post-segregation antitoxin (ccd killing protein)
VDITIYLPDELGERAKREEGLNLSRMLRDAVIEEFERRDAVSNTLEATRTFELDLENRDGRSYVGRITGTAIVADGDHEVYLTDDQRVIAYDANKLDYFEVDDPLEELSGWLNEPTYMEAMQALGLKPKVDL